MISNKPIFASLLIKTPQTLIRVTVGPATTTPTQMQYATPRPPLPSPTMKRDHHNHNHNHNNHHHQKPIHHSTIPCGACGSSDRWPLHTVRHRGSYRRLCTDCVLKNHQSLFCPLCFQVFDEMPPPLPADRLVCLNCPSIAHRSCVPPDSSAPSFLCPPCSNPNFSYFFSDSDPDAKTKRIKTEDGGGNSSLRGHNEKAIDKESAKALLAAAKIAAASMNKAAATAQAEAEKRVKDASLAKKKAKEALERLAFLVLKDKDKEKQDSKQLPLSVTPIQALISNKGNGSGGGDGGGAAAAKATNGLHSLSAAAAAFSQQSSGVGGHATKTPN